MEQQKKTVIRMDLVSPSLFVRVFLTADKFAPTLNSRELVIKIVIYYFNPFFFIIYIIFRRSIFENFVPI